MRMVDKEKAIITLVETIRLESKEQSVQEAAVVKAGAGRGLKDTKAIIDELVYIGKLYHPGRGLLAIVGL